MTDKPNTTNGEDISVRCFFDGERALHGSVHEDAPTRRVDKKNIIKDGCKPMTMEEAIAHAAEILEWYGSTSEVKQRTEKAHEAASILRKRETDGVESSKMVNVYRCTYCGDKGENIDRCGSCGDHVGLCTTIRKRSTVKQTLQITEARSAASFEKVERL